MSATCLFITTLTQLLFTGIKEKIPFVKPAPIDQEETKKQKKTKKGGGDKKDNEKEKVAEGVQDMKIDN